MKLGEHEEIDEKVVAIAMAHLNDGGALWEGVSVQVSPEFQHRCEVAAIEAMGIAKLRYERERIGFLALSFAAYITALAQSAKVSLDASLQLLGLKDLSTVTLDSIPMLARLASDLGMSFRQTLVHLRVSVAEREGFTTARLQLARRSQSPVGSLEQCERALALFEAEHPSVSAEVQPLERELRKHFES